MLKRFTSLTHWKKTIAISALLRYCAIALITFLLSIQPVTAYSLWGQVFIPNASKLIDTLSTTSNAFKVDQIYLDGHKLFSVTASTISPQNQGESEALAIEERTRTIEDKLYDIAQKSFNSNSLDVYYQIDPSIPLPTIYVNGIYLMTVTNADAQIYGIDPITHAKNLTTIIKNALIAYQKERQPDYLVRQGLIAGGLLMMMCLLSIIINRSKNYLEAKHQTALDAIEIPEPKIETSTENLSEAEQEKLANYVQERQQLVTLKNRTDFRYEFSERLLQIALIAVWVGGIAFCFSLFPQTRWLQSFVLKGLTIRIFKLLLITIGTYLIVRISFLAVDYSFELLGDGHFLLPSQSVRGIRRLQTLSGVIKGVGTFVVVGSGLLLGLATLGINLAPLLAGAGILGIAVSFGAQNLVKDFLNGIFILWEDQYGVGDVITINDANGLVEAMNLRITQLRSQDGELITIPNGTITTVRNLSNKWSRVNIGIDVAYKTDLAHALAVIRRVATLMSFDHHWREYILEPPEILGVDKFGENSITIRIWIKTQPLKQWEVGREFRLRLKNAFDREGISIPFPQRSLWLENSFNSQQSTVNGKQ